MRRVGTADLKAHLSEHLRAVRAGEELVVMDRREPIARVVPFDGDESLLVDLAEGSLADFPWPGPTPGPAAVDIVSTLLAERADRS
jgi:prevent-host-death family protein